MPNLCAEGLRSQARVSPVSLPCCGSRAEMARTHWGALSRSWLEAGHPASKARGRASNSGVPPKLTFFLCRHVSTDLDLPTRPRRRLSLSKTARDRQKHYLLQLNDLVVHVFLLSVDQGPRNMTWRATRKRLKRSSQQQKEFLAVP